MNDTNDGALVLFSGGQDSTTCLAWGLERFDRVETIGFDYGQRHAIEMDCRTPLLSAMRDMNPKWNARLEEDHVIDLGVLGQISETSLTRDAEITMEENGLPSTFVPGRNLVFLTFAAATAYRRGLSHIVGGMCETDYSGYPDCRDETMKSMQNTLRLGMDTNVTLHTPLMWLDKADTWALAEELGGDALIDLILEETHTCYLGERGECYDWGYGCGDCPACALRKKGWEQFQSQ